MGADRIIRWNMNIGIADAACEDSKVLMRPDRDFLAGSDVWSGQRGRMLLHRGRKSVDAAGITLGYDLHCARPVSHKAMQPEFSGKAIDERPEPYPLDPAVYQPATCAPFLYWGHVGASFWLRTPLAHHIRQAPSSETMQGPTGFFGVHPRP